MSETSGLEIAIVGCAGRFPGARDVAELWRNLCAGRESISFFSRDELAAAGVDAAALDDPNFVPARGRLAEADLFDAPFFDFTPREAQITDPQHRLFLECAWEALEDAGYDPGRFPGRIGVFAGVSMSTYLLFNLMPEGELIAAMGSFQAMLGNDKDFLPTRVSYKLNLRGPSVLVQTACSTSLVAVHLAGQSLLGGECEMALAGGVSVSFPQTRGYLYQDGGILSPDGRCRPFDARGRGTVNGDGLGIVVLKRLEDALGDGDAIRAVIKGSAINNDGSAKVGYTSPSVEGQSAVITAAQVMAGVTADSIGYVEAHGTATPLGDPIEVAALTRAFRATTDRRGFCALGALKANVGHLDAAAGVAGLLKTALALEHRLLPPNPHFESLNPEIDLADSPFYVPRELRPWPAADGRPRRAALSSFGIGGTNAHAVLEEAPPAPAPGPARAHQLLLLSARSEAALERAAAALATAVETRPEFPLADAAHTLQVGRQAFEHRQAVVCSSPAEAVALLRGERPRDLLRGRHEGAERPVCFLFPGQGAQYPGMAAEVYGAEPEFRRQIDRCAEVLRPLLGFDVRDLLVRPRDEEAAHAAERLRRTDVAQPLLFCVEYALAQLWIGWGVEPAALLGHSVGEYVAACLAGVFPLDDALRLVAARGRLMQQLPAGAMLSVPLPSERVAPLLGGDLALAAHNAPSLCVVAGPATAVERLQGELAAQGVDSRRLHVSHAFHSPMVAPVEAALLAELSRVDFAPPRRRFLSNVTGGWIGAAEATDPSYWVRHLRATVEFSRGVEVLLAEPEVLLLEVGPGHTLGRLVRQQPAWGPHRPVLASLPAAADREPSDAFLLRALGRLWLAGGPVDWTAFSAGERRRRVSLPTYPFERRSYWVAPPNRAAAPLAAAAPAVPEAAEPPAPPAAPEAPASDLETRLAGVWRDLLGVDGIGPADDFFELGGHSLLATQVLARVRDLLGAEVPLRRFMEAPTLRDLAAAVAETGTAARPPLRPVPRDGDLPLSFSQERLWVLDQLEPGSPAYNMAFAVRLEGPLDVAALGWSFGEIARRHEALRTVFAQHEERPVQRVLPMDGPFHLPVVDLAGLPAGPHAGETARLVAEDALLPFCLTRGPLFRVRLVALAPGEAALLVAFHHIIADGWSFGVIAQELSAFYAARVGGEGENAAPPAPLAVQYGDFACWQRAWLQGEALAAQVDYWCRQLAHAPGPLRLPTDRPLRPGASVRGALHPLAVPGDLAAALAAVGRGRRATLFMTLLAAFDVLLAFHAGQDDILVGSPVAGRGHRELEPLVGFFVNTVVLRTDLSGDPTFGELLDRVRRVTLEAYSHQDLPFERLVSALRLERDLHRTPLFRVWFVLQNTPAAPLRLPGLRSGPLPSGAVAARHDLKLDLTQGDDGLHGFFEYRTALFDRATVERLAEHFQTLLRQIAARPEARLRELTAALAEQARRRQDETKRDLRSAALEKLTSRRRAAG